MPDGVLSYFFACTSAINRKIIDNKLIFQFRGLAYLIIVKVVLIYSYRRSFVENSKIMYDFAY